MCSYILDWSINEESSHIEYWKEDGKFVWSMCKEIISLSMSIEVLSLYKWRWLRQHYKVHLTETIWFWLSWIWQNVFDKEFWQSINRIALIGFVLKLAEFWQSINRQVWFWYLKNIDSFNWFYREEGRI